MKFSTHWHFKILPLLYNQKMLKHGSASPIPQYAVLDATLFGNIIDRKNGLRKIPEKVELQDVETITGIAVAYNCVSWAKVSVYNRDVLDWNSYILPDFQKPINKSVILNIAHEVAPSIPHSDLHVIENPRRRMLNTNEFSLRCMLMALISSQYEKNGENVIFLSEKFVNKRHNLLIGGERMSPKEIIDKKLQLYTRKSQAQDPMNHETESGVQVTPENLDIFTSCTESQQGGLSLAVLIVLTVQDLFCKRNCS